MRAPLPRPSARRRNGIGAGLRSRIRYVPGWRGSLARSLRRVRFSIGPPTFDPTSFNTVGCVAVNDVVFVRVEQSEPIESCMDARGVKGAGRKPAAFSATVVRIHLHAPMRCRPAAGRRPHKPFGAGSSPATATNTRGIVGSRPSGCGSVWSRVLASEARDRTFESCHHDQRAQRGGHIDERSDRYLAPAARRQADARVRIGGRTSGHRPFDLGMQPLVLERRLGRGGTAGSRMRDLPPGP